jgi:two-component system sensor histidine kinase KdpD
VIGYVDLLSDPNSGMSGFERSQLLATVARQAGDVAELIEDLLVAAKAEAGTLRVQVVPVDLAAQTLQVLEGLDPIRVAAIGVDSQPCRALADPGRTRQVIRNLVTNAFRYGGEDISIRLISAGSRCRIEVADDGIGVAPGDEERIFETFQHSTTSRTVAESVGLGLAISRMLSELMGGTLTYERRDGNTVFALDLPAMAATPEAQSPPEPAEVTPA